ncbi:cyclic nucleotide-binding-like protein [Baffinella frigidus]|nr:cyclic nucleotide-binding-like protein [Cryptophyta sp. CCMP2293]
MSEGAWWLGTPCCGSARTKTTPRGTVELGELHRSNTQADGGDQLSPRRREELEEALELAEMEAILSRVPSMRHLTPNELSVLARSLERVALENGEYVYRQDQPAEDFFIILAGSVQKVVESTDPSKPGIPIAQPLVPSAFFGEKALVEPNGRRACSMKTVGNTELRRLQRQTLQRVVEESRGGAEVLLNT